MKIGGSKQQLLERAIVSSEQFSVKQLFTRYDTKDNIRYLVTFLPYFDFKALYGSNTEASACIHGTWFEFRRQGNESYAYCRSDRTMIHFHLASDDAIGNSNPVLKFECEGEFLGSGVVIAQCESDFFKTEKNFWNFTRNAAKAVAKIKCSKNTMFSKSHCDLPDILVLPTPSICFDSSLVQLH